MSKKNNIASGLRQSADFIQVEQENEEGNGEEEEEEEDRQWTDVARLPVNCMSSHNPS